MPCPYRPNSSAKLFCPRLKKKSIRPRISPGNDTIDCYPLCCGEVKKILCVSEQTFKEIRKDFGVFSRGIKGQPSQRSLNIEPPRGQILGSKVPLQAFSQKLNQTKSTGYFEPSNTIYLQYSDIRRWRRVNEWFRQYAHEVE